jgi:hypothetical protein
LSSNLTPAAFGYAESGCAEPPKVKLHRVAADLVKAGRLPRGENRAAVRPAMSDKSARVYCRSKLRGAQRVEFAADGKPAQRLGLDLAHTFARQAERLADCLERLRIRIAVQAEAHLQYIALPIR